MINVGKRKISLILLTLFLLPSVSSLFTTGQCDVQDITLMNQNVPRSPETAETGTDMVFIPNTTPESYPEEDEPMDISYSTTRTDGADEIPYTFFSTMNFTSIRGKEEYLWATDGSAVMKLKTDTGDMIIYEKDDGITERIHGMRDNGHALYLLGEENLFCYDPIDDGFRRSPLPVNINHDEIADFHPLIWENEEGGMDEGIVLAVENRILSFMLTDKNRFEKIYDERFSSEFGKFRWMDGYFDQIVIGFSDGMAIATHEELIESSVEISSESGGIYDRYFESNGVIYEIALASEGDIFGYTLTYGYDDAGVEITGNGTLWNAGLKGDITSMAVSGDIVGIALDKSIEIKNDNKEYSLSVDRSKDIVIINDGIFTLVNGRLFTVSGEVMEELNVHMNAPVPDIVNIDSGETILVASSNVSLSVLPGAVAPSRWINADAILGNHLERPVHCLDRDENIWVAQTSSVFRGTLANEEVSWSFYLVNSVNSPLSLSSLEEILVVLNTSTVVLFNQTTRTDEKFAISDSDTGSFLKCIADEYENCFWVLCENGVLKIYENANGTMNRSFFGRVFLPGDHLLDIGASNNIMWILTDTAVSRYYKPTGEWWNHTHNGDMLGSVLNKIYSRGHEVYLGGRELYYMDAWSPMGFMPVSFGDDKLGRIISMDGRDFQKDNSGELYLLDSGGIRIYDTSRSNWQSLTTSNGLASNDIRQVTKDSRTGDVWVAAYGGVTKYIPSTSTFEILTSDDGLPNNFLYTAHTDSNGVWLGTDGGGVCRITPDGEYNILTVDDGLAADDVLKIKNATDDRYWFCTDGGLTLYDHTNGDTTNYRSPEHLAGDWVWDVDSMDDGVFVACDGGISVLNTDTGKWQRFFHPLDLPDKTVFSLDLFRYNYKKYMWAGTQNGAVCYDINRNIWKNIDESSGLPDPRVRDVFFDGEKVWLATGQGVAVFTPDGEFIHTYTRQDGLVHNMVESFSSYDNVMYIATSGGFSMFREDTITSTLLPRYIRSPGIYPDISIQNYDANISLYEDDVNLLTANITVRSDVPGPFYLYVSTDRPEERFLALRSLYATGDISPDEGDEWLLIPVEPDPGEETVTVEIVLKTGKAGTTQDGSADNDDSVNLPQNIPLYIIVDPDGRWIEELETNNMLITTVDLPAEDVSVGQVPVQENSKNFGKWIGLVVIAAFVLGSLGYRLYSKRKRNDGDKKE
ncbi:MAG: hypothetical protein QGH39_03560 [Candidatus Thermoplasmatota archaeon]|nr:hypothetical protein [Candidatus Thermoplasmatota archaeon]